MPARETLSGEVEVDILWQLSPLHQIAKTEPCGTAQDGFGSLLCVFLAVSVNIKIEECKDLRMLLSSCATFIPTTMLDLGSTEYNGEQFSSLHRKNSHLKAANCCSAAETCERM